MNGHCGITGSTYRPVERTTLVTRMETPKLDRFDVARLLFLCLVFGVIVGAVMGVKL